MGGFKQKDIVCSKNYPHLLTGRIEGINESKEEVTYYVRDTSNAIHLLKGDQIVHAPIFKKGDLIRTNMEGEEKIEGVVKYAIHDQFPMYKILLRISPITVNFYPHQLSIREKDDEWI
ncbi:hypothetical protein vBAmePPT11V19_00039 [Alteromonas phage vB_AmeP_PT11-V19]|nr:hypothetical protein vBAmePPT11V19_00039 [Alteromonas phage vB_AmeP_PT11-V19]